MKKPTPSVRAALVVLLVVAATCSLPLLKLTLREQAAHFSLTGKAFVDVELAYQAASLAMVALLVLLVRWLGAPTRVLARGDMTATSEALPLLGIRAGERWSSIARNFAVITTTVTTIVVAAQVTTPGWLGHVPLALAMALPFAAVNAAVEEGLLRVALVEGVLDVFGPKTTALLSGAVFGGIHYFGVPAGIPGVAMAGFLGWLLARSVIGTRGVGLAWGIHALQDVVIFTMLFATAAALPS